jgi:hypothetical protein
VNDDIDHDLLADWIFRIVRDRTEGWGELYWQHLKALDPKLAALAMVGNPAFGDSVR